jgi:EAL domain-containing protein (putative c-di-GMP-specific phosphodiesterase class I)
MTSLNAPTVHIAAQQPILYLQPIVSVGEAGCEVVCQEALVRFNIDGQVFEPGPILQKMKKNGTLPQLDRAMVLAVVMELARRRSVHGVSIPVHVNVSQQTLLDTGFAEYAIQVLRFNGVPPRLLVVEIVEGRSFWKNDRIMRTLTLLEKSGVNIAIDDFPNYDEPAELLHCLRYQSVHSLILKLDRTFVRKAIESGEGSERMLELGYYIWHMKKRGITLIAEGVETPALRAALERVGVTHMQGYLFGRPQPANEVQNSAKTNVVALTSLAYRQQLAA